MGMLLLCFNSRQVRVFTTYADAHDNRVPFRSRGFSPCPCAIHHLSVGIACRVVCYGPTAHRTYKFGQSSLAPSLVHCMGAHEAQSTSRTLRSRWMTRLEWQYCTADTICRNFSRASFSFIRPASVCR